MPKTSVSSAMKAHLAQGVTTLAACWQIVRTDGLVFGFTTFDSDLVIDGVNYLSTSGFSSTAIQSGATGQVDNLQVLGYFSSGPGGITDRDVKNRLFDYARVFLFFVNWANQAMAPIKIRTGWLGETVVAPNGSFAAELRGLTQALVQELGNFISPLCRNDLGDQHCKIPILPPLWSANQPINAGDYVRALTQPNDTMAMAIFQSQVTGLTAPTEPIWDPTVGNSTPDYQVVWLCKPAYRQIGTVVTPIDQHSFNAGSLSYPAITGVSSSAAIDIRNSVSRGSAIEVTDGTTTLTISFTDDTKESDAISFIRSQLASSSLNMTYADNSNGVVMTNLTGLQGDVTKTGDILGAILIDNFGSPILDAGGLTWITGANTGVSMEIKHYDPATGIVELYLGMLMPILGGDRFWYYPGCDKRRDTCVKIFDNIVNNRSEPDVPGIDKMLSYPDE